MESQKLVWVIGAKNTEADKSLAWNEKFPNLSDPDVLILNLTSLDANTLTNLDDEKYSNLKNTLADKFSNGGIIIFITSAAYLTPTPTRYNYFFCPIGIGTEEVEEGKIIKIHDKEKNPFSEYIEKVGSFNFYISSLDTSFLRNRLDSPTIVQVSELSQRRVTDNAGHKLSVTYSILKLIGTGGEMWSRTEDSGEIIFLPPTKSVSIEDGINNIVSVYGKKISTTESAPIWLENVKIPGLEKKKTELATLQTQKQHIEKKIYEKQTEKQELINHNKLLFANGKMLEKQVLEAFRILGFKEIGIRREEDLEDGIFDFKFDKRKQFGIIEVKGSDKRTSLANLTQCNKWVEDYLLQSKTGKGIFVPNQFRLVKYPDSKKDRVHFEKNELEYAKTREICIIPTYVLFEAVNKKLEGKGKSRNTLEKLILDTNGLLTSF